MPKRVLDFDAMWGSDKLAACAPWAQAEYAWLYGLADASGCFELTNLRVIWGRVAAIRGSLTIERLEQVFAEFQDQGLLFVWEHEGKRYGHWTGSDVPGRLPPPSWRMRLERFAPPVPKQELAKYMARFARGRAALGAAGFRTGPGGEGSPAQPDVERAGQQEHLQFEISNLRPDRNCGPQPDSLPGGESWARGGAGKPSHIAHANDGLARGRELNPGLERAPAQDLDLDRDWKGNGDAGRQASAGHACAGSHCAEEKGREGDSGRTDSSISPEKSNPRFHSHPQYDVRFHSAPMSAKELAVARELRVGQGPVCGPSPVKAEVIERDRQRQAAQRASRSR